MPVFRVVTAFIDLDDIIRAGLDSEKGKQIIRGNVRMEHNQNTVTVNDWVIRISEPQVDGPHPVIVLLHGWTGDENAMWIFASRLPKDALLVAPRGSFNTPLGGHGWYPHKPKAWPWVDDFLPAIEALQDLLTPINFPNGDFSKLSLVGFSQGAALSFAYAILFPNLVRTVASLSGFLPEGSEALARNKPLHHKPIFMAHGTQDELVPVYKARQAVEVLELAGAKVTYCEDEVGHKLSANCFRGLESFFKKVKS